MSDTFHRHGCPYCEAEKLRAENKRLKTAIRDFREGNYQHPRSYRKSLEGRCPHGARYWESCNDCDESYWQRIDAQIEKGRQAS